MLMEKRSNFFKSQQAAGAQPHITYQAAMPAVTATQAAKTSWMVGCFRAAKARWQGQAVSLEPTEEEEDR